jgi:TRAP-type C4-dicarboxylate transport system substrate-binding protein
LEYAQKPYQYFADAYIMANRDWFDSLPEDLQSLVMEVGAEVGELATNTILDAGENTLSKFVDRGGIVTTLSGSEKAKFNAMMADKVMPAMADMFDSEVLLEAEKFASQ